MFSIKQANTKSIEQNQNRTNLNMEKLQIQTWIMIHDSDGEAKELVNPEIDTWEKRTVVSEGNITSIVEHSEWKRLDSKP